MNKKVAWVTGASSGIGAATALRMARDGWAVVISARSVEKLQEVAAQAALQEFSGRIVIMPCDITNKEAIQKTVADISRGLGQIDCVLLNAGTYIADPVEKFSSANFNKQVALNLSGTAMCLEAVLPEMLARGSGHIAVVASVAGYRGLPKSLSYGPTKAALINMVEALAIETKDKGIKVQLINPGFIKTPLTDVNTFPMPFLMDVDVAADRLVRGLNSNAFEIIFPRRFAYMLKILQLLPHRLYIWLLARSARNV